MNAKKAGYRVLGFETLGSTNAVAKEAAREARAARGGSGDRLWVASLAQSAGRARRGRAWQSEKGNLAASLVTILPKDGPEPGLLGFVAALALLRALGSLDTASGSGPGLSLKWPNDVLANGAKLAGILLEAERLDSGEMAVVAGIGVNVTSAPEDLPYAATCLAQLGINGNAQSLFSALSGTWVEVFDLWNYGQGREQILDEWRAGATGLGRPVVVKRSRDRVHGIFEQINSQGQLVVRQKSGHRTIISAGEVFFE